MKPLYYLEIAKSIDENNQLIPVKSLKWKIRIPKVAWEDPESCNNERVEIQCVSGRYIIRITQAGWLKNIFIRLSRLISDEWVVIKE